MAIVFEQPGPLDMGAAEAYGRLQQQNINYDRDLRAGGGGRGGGGGVGPTGDYGSAPTGGYGGGGGGVLDTRFQDQYDLYQAELNTAENLRLQRLEQAESAIDANDSLTPEERQDLKMQVRTGPAGLDVLQRRQAMATIRRTEMQNQAMQRAMAQQEAMNIENVRQWAQNIQAQTAVLNNPGMEDEIRSEMLSDPYWTTQDQATFNREMNRRLREQGGQTEITRLPDGTLAPIHWPYLQRGREQQAQQQAQERERVATEREMEAQVRREVREQIARELQAVARSATHPETTLPPRPEWMHGGSQPISPLDEAGTPPSDDVIRAEIARRVQDRIGQRPSGGHTGRGGEPVDYLGGGGEPRPVVQNPPANPNEAADQFFGNIRARQQGGAGGGVPQEQREAQDQQRIARNQERAAVIRRWAERQAAAGILGGDIQALEAWARAHPRAIDDWVARGERDFAFGSR